MRVKLAVIAVVLAVPLVLPAQPSREQSDAVFEAALRGVAKEFVTEEVRSTGAVACLRIDPGGAPQSISKEFMPRFRELSFMRRGAECEARPKGAVERTSQAPAFIITAGPIEWASGVEAHVRVTYFRSETQSGTRLYRVVKEASGWVSLGQIIKMSPAGHV